MLGKSSENAARSLFAALEKLRKKRGISQTKMAEEMGFSRKVLSDLDKKGRLTSNQIHKIQAWISRYRGVND